LTSAIVWFAELVTQREDFEWVDVTAKQIPVCGCVFYNSVFGGPCTNTDNPECGPSICFHPHPSNSPSSQLSN